MKKLVIILGVLLTQVSIAQEYVHQVLVLNEGYFDYSTSQIIEPPTIGSYNPQNQTYTVVATIDSTRFASDMIIDGEYFYVAADNKILKYSIDNYTLLAETTVPGVRNLMVHNGILFASRGEYMVSYDSYLHVYNTNDLSFITSYDTISGPKWATQNMIVNDDMLYVSINNGFEWGNEKGLIGIIDLQTMYYTNEIDLGPDGTNPDNMVFDGTYIYTINNKDWSGSSISKLDLITSTPTTINMSMVSTGCGTSCLRDNTVMYQISGETEIYEWDTQSMPSYGTSVGFNDNFYELSMDNLNGHLYASTTDFVSTGTVHIYDSANVFINSFMAGTSPGVIIFDVRSNTVSISELTSKNILKGTTYDIFGKKLKSITNQPTGIYIVDGKKAYYDNRK